MFPRSVFDNTAYCFSVHVGNEGEAPDGYMPGCIDTPDFRYSLLSKFSRESGGDLRTFNIASLCDHVIHIVLCGSQKQMIRSDAQLHVTLMKNQQAVGNESVMDFPRETMGHNRLSVGQRVTAITTGYMACPQPTAICLMNMQPETLKHRLGFRTAARIRTQVTTVIAAKAGGFSTSRSIKVNTLALDAYELRTASARFTPGSDKLREHRKASFRCHPRTANTVSGTFIHYNIKSGEIHEDNYRA